MPDNGVGSNSFCQRPRAASRSVTPTMTSFTASTPSGPPPLSANCLRRRSRRCSTFTYVGLYSLRKTCIVASAASPSENCRKVTFVHSVFFEPSCPVAIKGRRSPYVIPRRSNSARHSANGGGLESKSEQLRPRRLALLPGESNRFDVHVAESDPSGRDAFSRAHHGPSNGKSKDFSEKGVKLGRVIRPDHDVVDPPDGRCGPLRSGVDATKHQQDRRREKRERSSLGQFALASSRRLELHIHYFGPETVAYDVHET